MSNLCDMQIHINGQETFFLNQKILCAYSEKLRKIVMQERKRIERVNNNIIMSLEIDDFPGGPQGFELVTRLLLYGDNFTITFTNVALLYCCSIFLGVTNTLLLKTRAFLEGMAYWSLKEVVCCLKGSGLVFDHMDSNGLLEKLVRTLLSKISSNNSDSSSSSSSSDTSCSSNKSWWFDDLTLLHPKIVERVVDGLRVNTSNENGHLVVTKFLLHYLKLASARGRASTYPKGEFANLAGTTVRGVVSSGRRAFSVRSLFGVLRVTSGFGVSRTMRLELERLIGEVLDESKLDDILVSNSNNGGGCGVYDVNLVIRLVRVFVSSSNDHDHDDGEVSLQKMRKVGRLVDWYLGEISPDHSLKVSKFLGVAESVPDSARDCFDGVYRAIDIYLESHPTLSSDERSKLCRCLNYQKLTLEACKELAKNPKIPPRIAMQALISQQPKVPTKEFFGDQDIHRPSPIKIDTKKAMYSGGSESESFIEQGDHVKINLQRMQTRVVELEKVCREMKGQMTRMVGYKSFGTPTHSKNLPRLC